MAARVMAADVVVVGAGTAGANVAQQLAAAGRHVVLVERRAFDIGGAQWHNGVLDRHFDRAGVPRPVPPERVARGRATHLIGPDGTAATTVHDSPIVTADMALLGRRLRAAAQEAGVATIDHVDALSPRYDGERLVALDVVVGDAGEVPGPLRLEAALFVDASGRAGVLRRTCEVLAPWCPPLQGDELCAAGDHQLAVADAGGASAFLRAHGARPGESVTMVGLNGGFSTRAVTVSEDLSHASVLVGLLADGRDGTAAQMLAAARADLPWLGEPTASGSGLIPLRRPYARCTAPGLALVGDAACQVFCGHGSGIGIGLIAGRLLRDAVAGSVDPGDARMLWRYQHAFQRELGGTLAAFDAFRRLSSALGTDGVTAMVHAGLMTERLARAGLDQRWDTPAVAELPATLRRLGRAPALAARMAPALARAQLALREGARHPAEPDLVALRRWDRRVARLVGERPARGFTRS
jgi:flavin-dependent dehydrogenase